MAVQHVLLEQMEHFAKFANQLIMLHLTENAMKNAQHISMELNLHHQLVNLVHKIVQLVMLQEFATIVITDAQHKIVNVEKMKDI